MGKWLVKISSLKFQVQHIKGTQNVVADTLSCMISLPSQEPTEQPCSVFLDFPMAFTEILPHHLDYEELGLIIKNLKEGKPQPPYFLSKGVLSCREGKEQVPSKLVSMFFRCYYDSPVGGRIFAF